METDPNRLSIPPIGESFTIRWEQPYWVDASNTTTITNISTGATATINIPPVQDQITWIDTHGMSWITTPSKVVGNYEFHEPEEGYNFFSNLTLTK